MKKKFLIFSQSRTGSTLLKQLIDSHPSINCEGEIFTTTDGYLKNKIVCEIHKKFPYPYIYYRSSLTNDDLYGFTLFIYHLPRIKQTIKQLHKLGWKIIYLKRRNIVNQSLSNIIAMQSDHWHKFGDKKISVKTFHIPVEKFIQVVRNRIRWHNREADIIKNIPYFPVFYEDNLEAQEVWPDTAEKIFGFLGTSNSQVKSNLSKTYPKPYSELVENFEELMEALKEHQLDSLLDWEKQD